MLFFLFWLSKKYFASKPPSSLNKQNVFSFVKCVGWRKAKKRVPLANFVSFASPKVILFNFTSNKFQKATKPLRRGAAYFSQ